MKRNSAARVKRSTAARSRSREGGDYGKTGSRRRQGQEELLGQRYGGGARHLHRAPRLRQHQRVQLKLHLGGNDVRHAVLFLAASAFQPCGGLLLLLSWLPRELPSLACVDRARRHNHDPLAHRSPARGRGGQRLEALARHGRLPDPAGGNREARFPDAHFCLCGVPCAK